MTMYTAMTQGTPTALKTSATEASTATVEATGTLWAAASLG